MVVVVENRDSLERSSTTTLDKGALRGGIGFGNR